MEKNAEFPVGCNRVARSEIAWKFWAHEMSEPVKEIEVEVLEIDGVKQDSRIDDEARGRSEQRQVPPWAGWHGKVRGLDRRWWPLWVVVGMLLAFFAVVAGVAAMAAMFVVRMAGGLVKALRGGGSGRVIRFP